MYPGHMQGPYHQTVTGFLHHSPLPALPPSHLPTSNYHQHQHLIPQTNSNGGDGGDADGGGGGGGGASASATAILLFESRQTNREVRLQITDAQLKLDRLLAKVDEIGSERSSDVVLRGSSSSSLSANASGFEPFRPSQFQLARENDELKSRVSELTTKLESQQDNISRLLENNQKLLEQNVDLMGRSFDSPGHQSKSITCQEGILMLNSLSGSAAEELESLKVELASTRTRETECQRQIEKLIRIDQENKLRLQQTDLQLKDLSQATDRLSTELNEEKKRRKEAEMTSRALSTDAEETKAKNAALQKTLSELRMSSKLKITELESDLKSLQDNHQKEMSFVKDRFRKDKSRLQEDQSELLCQTEEGLRSSWKRKYENLEKTLKDRHSVQLEELTAEKSFFVDRVASLEQKMTELKSQRAAEESIRAALLSEMEEYKTWKAKYDNLRSQAIAMKERYAQQMDGLREENSLLEEKCSRMTDKFYKAEESLNIANQKYDEFKVGSLDGRREFETRVHLLEAELASTKSELDEALRRAVQTQLDNNEAKNKHLRLVERFEELEKEREVSHAAKAMSVTLARMDRGKVKGHVAPPSCPHEDAKEFPLTPPGGASSSTESEPKMEKHEHEQEDEEEQDARPEVKEPDEDDDDDDGDSFVTAIDDEEVIWCMEEKAEDATCFEETLCVTSHLDLRTDDRTTFAVDLDIARASLSEYDSGTGIDTGDLEVANAGSQTNDLEIRCDFNFSNAIWKSNDPVTQFDPVPENSPELNAVANMGNESDLTMLNRPNGTSRDVSTGMNLRISRLSDVHSSEEITELDTDVTLDSIPDESPVHLSSVIAAGPTAPPATTPQNSDPEPETPSYDEPTAAVGGSYSSQNGGFDHEVGITGKVGNAVDEKLGAESGLQEPIRSASSNGRIIAEETPFENLEVEGRIAAGKLENTEANDGSEIQSESVPSAQSNDGNRDGEISGDGFERKRNGGKPGKLESGEEQIKHREDEGGKESASSVSGRVGNPDESNSDLGINLDAERETGDDSTYAVTSGGKIVPGNVAESEAVGGGLLADDEGGQPSFRDDVEGVPFSGLDERKSDAESKWHTGTVSGSFDEDLLYTVTSGGQIIPGWTDVEDEASGGGVLHTIPEVDHRYLIGGTIDLDITEFLSESSSAIGTTGASDASSNQALGEGLGSSEVLETGNEVLHRKPEEPVSRMGACVILREEDIEEMRERQRNDSSSEKIEKKQKKKKSKKTGR